MLQSYPTIIGRIMVNILYAAKIYITFQHYNQVEQQVRFMRTVYGRGLNIIGQVDSSYKNYKKFTPIKQLSKCQVKALGCGYLQSYYLLKGGQLIKSGYEMDTLSNARILNYYRLLPFMSNCYKFMKKIKKTIGLHSKQNFTLLNKKQIQAGISFQHAVFGHAGVHLFDQNNNMYTIGENTFGQRATSDNTIWLSSMRKVQYLQPAGEKPTISKGNQVVKKLRKQKVKDAALGFQHTILITQSGEAYGCGKTDCYQIQPFRYRFNRELITVDKVLNPQLIYGKRRVIKAGCGYKHSLILTEDGKLFALGLNKFGQCGIDYTQCQSITKITEVFFPYLNGQKIIDLKCGSNHTLILTNINAYFMGIICKNQNPFIRYQENVSSPTIINLPSKPIKIFVNLDRSAIITQDGKAYLFGGKDMSHLGGQSGELDIVQDFTFNKDSLIGLGFSHTIIYP